jgi:hypothetical protein
MKNMDLFDRFVILCLLLPVGIMVWMGLIALAILLWRYAFP